MLLWFWRRLVATAPIVLLAWELSKAASAALQLNNKMDRRSREYGVPVVAQWLTNPTRNHEVVGSIPALAQWVKEPALLCTVV